MARVIVNCMVNPYTLVPEPEIMRTNVVLDDDLIREALRLTGIKTKRRAVEEELRLLVRVNRQTGARRFRGKLKWTADDAFELERRVAEVRSSADDCSLGFS